MIRPDEWGVGGALCSAAPRLGGPPPPWRVADGERTVFDRAWTLVSVLLLGLLTALFSFDFWVA